MYRNHDSLKFQLNVCEQLLLTTQSDIETEKFLSIRCRMMCQQELVWDNLETLAEMEFQGDVREQCRLYED